MNDKNMDDKKTILQKLVEWNKERLLLESEFNQEKEISFIVEELLESTGEHDSISARPTAEKIAKEIVKETNTNKEQVVDAFADIIVFATGVIAKQGYSPDKVMEEVFKEINSRKGKVMEGKFVKDKNIKFYKADFSKCKLKN